MKDNNFLYHDILRRYDRHRKDHPDRQAEHCKEQNNLASAIYYAACGIDAEKKLHNHQFRIGYEHAKKFAQHLQLFEKEIDSAKDFKELYDTVWRHRIHKIGALTVYDTAQRIGEFKKLYPVEIFLHCGSRQGAINLFGAIGKKDMLPVTDFPKEWVDANLTAHDIENILCIYKDHFKLLF